MEMPCHLMASTLTSYPILYFHFCVKSESVTCRIFILIFFTLIAPSRSIFEYFIHLQCMSIAMRIGSILVSVATLYFYAMPLMPDFGFYNYIERMIL